MYHSHIPLMNANCAIDVEILDSVESCILLYVLVYKDLSLGIEVNGIVGIGLVGALGEPFYSVRGMVQVKVFFNEGDEVARLC